MGTLSRNYRHYCTTIEPLLHHLHHYGMTKSIEPLIYEEEELVEQVPAGQPGPEPATEGSILQQMDFTE